MIGFLRAGSQPRIPRGSEARGSGSEGPSSGGGAGGGGPRGPTGTTRRPEGPASRRANLLQRRRAPPVRPYEAIRGHRDISPPKGGRCLGPRRARSSDFFLVFPLFHEITLPLPGGRLSQWGGHRAIMLFIRWVQFRVAVGGGGHGGRRRPEGRRRCHVTLAGAGRPPREDSFESTFELASRYEQLRAGRQTKSKGRARIFLYRG